MNAPRAAFVLLWSLAPAVCAAQDLAPRAYFPAPVSSNAVILTYSFADGEILVDPTLPVTDATGRIHSPVVSGYHAFNLMGRSANFTGSLPFALADLRGTVAGADRATHRAGSADVVVRVAVNLWGGPARSPAEFATAPRMRSLFGASLKVVLPTGQYDSTRLVNIGSNRWAFKPEVAYVRRMGRVFVEVYGGIWFFTANDDFLATAPDVQGGRRTQAAIGAWELHVSYDVKPRLWISADVNYWRGGRTTVNGVAGERTLQANSRSGLTGSVPLSRRQSLKVSYSDGVTIRVGGNFKVLSVGWQYGWLGRPFGKT